MHEFLFKLTSGNFTRYFSNYKNKIFHIFYLDAFKNSLKYFSNINLENKNIFSIGNELYIHQIDPRL
jgi:hypothetical protein